jgi:hypothetical protein
MLLSALLFAEENNLGDPDTWPEAAVWITFIVVGGAVWIAWLKYRD